MRIDEGLLLHPAMLCMTWQVQPLLAHVYHSDLRPAQVSERQCSCRATSSSRGNLFTRPYFTSCTSCDCTRPPVDMASLTPTLLCNLLQAATIAFWLRSL